MPAAPLTMDAKLAQAKTVLAAVLALNLLFWCASRDVYVRWAGVPPVPARTGAIMMSLGDPELSYRSLALMLQNLGDVGADVTPLKDYDYKDLGRWFFLLHDLDPVSDYMPFIAAYYFGATKVPKDSKEIVNYLSTAGQVPLPEKWRWLVQAIYLAQHRVYDFDLALKLAYTLVKLPGNENFPEWARHMPAFVLNNRGDKEAARELMESMLATQNLRPDEIAAMKGFLTEQLGVEPAEVDQIIRMRGGR